MSGVSKNIKIDISTLPDGTVRMRMSEGMKEANLYFDTREQVELVANTLLRASQMMSHR